MCEPTTLLTIGSTVLGGAVQHRNAKRQEKASRVAGRQRAKDIQTKNSVEAQKRIRAARKARARIKAQAASSGVTGNSIDSLLNNEDFIVGTDVATLELDTRRAQNSNTTNTQSQLNSSGRPDLLGIGLQIGGDVLNNRNNRRGT